MPEPIQLSAERSRIDGPVGPLEALIETPADADISHVAVLCHPHPLHGGTMTNKVVHTLARAFNELHAPTVRFNYRGVGASAGTYGEGLGETDDTLAVLDWAKRRWPQAELWLGGFSFGGAVAIRASTQRDVRRLVTVAPAIQRVDVSDVPMPQCPWLVVQGDSDELIDANEIRQWIDGLPVQPQLVVLNGAEHFFHGRLNDLRNAVIGWVRTA